MLYREGIGNSFIWKHKGSVLQLASDDNPDPSNYRNPGHLLRVWEAHSHRHCWASQLFGGALWDQHCPTVHINDGGQWFALWYSVAGLGLPGWIIPPIFQLIECWGPMPRKSPTKDTFTSTFLCIYHYTTCSSSPGNTAQISLWLSTEVLAFSIQEPFCWGKEPSLVLIIHC